MISFRDIILCLTKPELVFGSMWGETWSHCSSRVLPKWVSAGKRSSYFGSGKKKKKGFFQFSFEFCITFSSFVFGLFLSKEQIFKQSLTLTSFHIFSYISKEESCLQFLSLSLVPWTTGWCLLVKVYNASIFSRQWMWSMNNWPFACVDWSLTGLVLSLHRYTLVGRRPDCLQHRWTAQTVYFKTLCFLLWGPQR